MAAAYVGGTIIIPAPRSPSEDRFFGDLAQRQHAVNCALTKDSLLRLFATRHVGHDGAVIVDVLGLQVPWIRSSRHHLNYHAAAFSGAVENRGLRHNSAAYASTVSDSLFIVISEEHGTVSVFHNASQYVGISEEELFARIRQFAIAFAPDEAESLGEENCD